MIPRERILEQTVKQIIEAPVPQAVKGCGGSGPDHPQERISKSIIDCIFDVPVVLRRQVPTTHTVQKTVQKTVEVPQVRFLD